jgi:CRISPR/Cas system-associated exonuclease Cas4 (RecB family)
MLEWTWSHSRSTALDHCNKAFAYSVAGSQTGTTGGIRLHSLVGNVVHQAVADYITAYSDGREPDWASVQRGAGENISRLWRARATAITECSNGFDVDPELIHPYSNAVRTYLERWFTQIWPRFKQLRYHTHERRCRFEISGHQAQVQLDYCCWDRDGTLVIVDWKTGAEAESTVSRLQLTAYSLWAHQELHVDAARMKACIASLRTGRITEFLISPEDFEYAENRVKEDFARTLAWKDGEEAAANPSMDGCPACPFLGRCATAV